MAKILYLRDKCIGCFSCVQSSPENWEIGEDGKAVLINSEEKKGIFIKEIGGIELEENKEAERTCSSKAIKIVK